MNAAGVMTIGASWPFSLWDIDVLSPKRPRSASEDYRVVCGVHVVTSEPVTPAGPENKRTGRFPSLFDMALFALLSGVLLLGAWMATTGRVMYILVMLVIGGALVYAVLDLAEYEIVKRKRRG
jgi:hypothetical protein